MIKRTARYFWSVRHQFAKYFVVGFSGVFLDMGTLILFKEKFGWTPVFAVVINQIFLLTYNFFLNKYWSFRNREMPHKQLVRFLSLAGFNYVFSVIMMYIFSDHFNEKILSQTFLNADITRSTSLSSNLCKHISYPR